MRTIHQFKKSIYNHKEKKMEMTLYYIIFGIVLNFFSFIAILLHMFFDENTVEKYIKIRMDSITIHPFLQLILSYGSAY